MKKILCLLLCAGLIQSCHMCKYLSVSGDVAYMAGVGMAHEMGGESWEPRIGGVIGAETQLLKFNENSKVNTGLNVSFQGAGWEESYSGYGYEGETLSGKVNLTYLNIPFLYSFESNKGIGFDAGIQPAVLMFAKDNYNGNSENYRDYVSNFDLGVPLGVHYKINKQMRAGVRAVFGLINTDSTGSEVKDHNLLAAGYFSYTLPTFNKKKSGKE